MNKQIFLSLALAALVNFSAVQAEEGAPATDAPKIELSDAQQVNPTKSENPIATDEAKKVEKPNDSRIRAALNSLRGFYDNHSTIIKVGAGAVAVTYVAHKVMYIKCPWYRNWVDGTDEESEANKLPWAKI